MLNILSMSVLSFGCVLLRINFTDFRHIFNRLSVLLIPYSNVKDMHVQSALQIVVLIEHTRITQNVLNKVYSVCYFTLSYLSRILQSKNGNIALCLLKNSGKIQD